MRGTSTLARARIVAAASFGTSPASASVSVAANSTSSHFWKRFASRPIRLSKGQPDKRLGYGRFLAHHTVVCADEVPRGRPEAASGREGQRPANLPRSDRRAARSDVAGMLRAGAAGDGVDPVGALRYA